MTALVALALTPAHAQHSYADEAEARMSLDFDLDLVEAELKAKRRAPRAAEAASEAYGYEEPVPQQPIVERLPLEPNSTVRSVTVFRDRALVTRTRDLDVSKGPHTVVFEGLPHGIRSDGLTGLVVSGSARIVGVELLSSTGEVIEDARYEAIRDEALDLTQQLGEVRDRIEALLGQRAYLRFTLLAQRGEGAPQPALATVRDTLTFVGSAEAELARQLREQEERAKELGESLQPLLVKMKNPVATGRTARIELDSDGGKATIGLRYQVNGARWEPAYNARLRDDVQGDDQVELEYFGIVRQDTGESWTDARLALSTANASGSASLPSLTPWFLGREDGSSFSLDPGSVATSVASGEGPPESELVSSKLTAKVEGSGAVVFAIDGRRTIQGDDSSQRIALGRQVFTARLDYATVPKLVPEVHRRASIRYAGDIPMLPGTLATFVGSDFRGSGSTPAVVPGEALRLSFGDDERLKVSRQLVSRRIEKLGLRQRTTRYHFHFRITVSNFSGQPRTVELRDQLPISELEKVEVETVKLTPGSKEDLLAGPGIRSWSLEIPDGGEEVVDLEFTVTAPTDVAQTALRSMQLLF